MSEFAGELVEEAKWWKQHWPVFALVAILVAMGAIGALVPSYASGDVFKHTRVFSWLALFALLLGFALVIGKAVTHHWRGVLIDDRNRLSTSRLQMLLWTVLVLSAYLGIVLANVGAGVSAPLVVSVPSPLWWAMGVSTFSLTTSPFLLKFPKDDGNSDRALHTNTSADQARWADLVTGEFEGLENTIDFGKLQMVLVTVVLILGYGVVLGFRLDNLGVGIHHLPQVSDAFAAFLGISHGAYLAKKRAPRLDTPPVPAKGN